MLMNELLQINLDQLTKAVDERNLEVYLNKQAAIAESWVKLTNQQREDDASVSYHKDRKVISHVPKSIDRGLDQSFNARMEAEVSFLDAQTLDNLNEYKSETDIKGMSDVSLNNFIKRQRIAVTEATERYDALKIEHQELLEKLEEVKQNGGDYLAVRDEILKSESKLDEGVAKIIESREELNKAAEALRERMFERGEDLGKINHPIAESYKEHLIEHELAKGQMQRNLSANGNNIESFDTDIGRLHQRLTVSEKQLQNLESRWDKLNIEKEVVENEIKILEAEMPKESVKLTEEEFAENYKITRKGEQSLSELKTYYRNNTHDNFSVGSRASMGAGPNMTNIENRDQAFTRRQEMLLDQARGMLSTDPLKAERIENMRQFEYHEFKASVNNKIASMPGVATDQHRVNEAYHDKQSAKFATRLAEIDYKLAERAQKENPSLEMPTRLAVLASNVRKSEAVKEIIKEQADFREAQKVMNSLGYSLAPETSKYKEMKDDLSQLNARKSDIESEKTQVLEKIGETKSNLHELNKNSLEYKNLNKAAQRLVDKRAEHGITNAIPTLDEINLSRLKSQEFARTMNKENVKQNEESIQRSI